MRRMHAHQSKDKPKALKRDSIYNIDYVVLEKRVSSVYLHLP